MGQEENPSLIWKHTENMSGEKGSLENTHLNAISSKLFDDL